MRFDEHYTRHDYNRWLMPGDPSGAARRGTTDCASGVTLRRIG